MTSYSAFFSSGLSAPRFSPPPQFPLSPAIPSSPVPMDYEDRSRTPTPNSLSSSTTGHVQDSTNTHHRAPSLRKRRSSLTLGSAPLASIKSASRNAGTAFQRHMSTVSVGATAPGFARTRSGSIVANAVESKSDVKMRSRSGSVGTALRPRGKSLRRAALPPPSAPLPPLPALYSTTNFPMSAPSNKTSFSVPKKPTGVPDNMPTNDAATTTPERKRARAYSVENGYKIFENDADME